MKVSYDQEVDVAYIQLSSHKTDCGVELANGVVLHATVTDEIVGIEILNAKTRISLNSLYQYELKSLRHLPLAEYRGNGWQLQFPDFEPRYQEFCSWWSA